MAGEGSRKEDPPAGAGHRAAEERAEDDASDREARLEGQEGGRRERAPEPSGEKARADAVDRRPRVQFQRPPGQPFAEGGEHALAEGLVRRPKRGAEASVTG